MNTGFQVFMRLLHWRRVRDSNPNNTSINAIYNADFELGIWNFIWNSAVNGVGKKLIDFIIDHFFLI